MKESKGGTFSNIDIQLIKRALYSYKDEIMVSDMVDLEVEKECFLIANLLHRLGRISS